LNNKLFRRREYRTNKFEFKREYSDRAGGGNNETTIDADPTKKEEEISTNKPKKKNAMKRERVPMEKNKAQNE